MAPIGWQRNTRKGASEEANHDRIEKLRDYGITPRADQDGDYNVADR